LGGIKNGYSFTTSNTITYEVTFKPTPYLFGEDSTFSLNTFEFSLLVSANALTKSLPFDKAIAPTIAAIFVDFYSKAEDTIAIYICDSSDGRQLLRQRKFNDWFEIYKKETFIKIDSGFVESNGTFYPVSLIIKNKNPHRVQIFEAFLNVIDGYNADK
jgi:chorismate synthase